MAITDLVDDSRAVRPGCLFVARTGFRADGRQFIPDAVAAGAGAVLVDAGAAAEVPGTVAVLAAEDVAAAAAALAERLCNEPARSLRLIGVTGTNGKTTVTTLTQQLLRSHGIACGLIGTVVIDDGRAARPAAMTTPPAMEISRAFAAMVANGCRAAVMEVSSHALDQGRTLALDFEVAVFTNLTGDHLDYHGTTEAYAEAKARLFAGLAPRATAVVNADDPASARMLRHCQSQRVLRCSLSDLRADCFAEIGRQSIGCSEVAMTGPWGRLDVALPLTGRHNAINALQAAASAWALGLDAEALRRGLAGCIAPPGRLERVTAPESPFAVLVDYAHSDDALAHALRTLRPLAAQLRVVFGCGGDRDRTKRPRMGAVAAQFADELIVTSDNPRSEPPESIIEEIMGGVPGERRDATVAMVDRRSAIACAVGRCQPGDVLLIAGKGHEDHQIIGTQRRPFDDRQVAAEALRGQDGRG